MLRMFEGKAKVENFAYVNISLQNIDLTSGELIFREPIIGYNTVLGEIQGVFNFNTIGGS